MSDVPLDVLRIGAGRVRIRGADPDSPVLSDLLAWLGKRPEVLDVDYRLGTGAIDVRYRDRGLVPGAFLQTLEDRLYQLHRPPPVPFSISILRASDGRVRLGLTGATDDDVTRLAAWLGGRAGVTRASASPASDSVLVLFDPGVLDAARVLSDALASERAHWPDAPPPERSHWGATAFNTAVLAACASGLVPPPALALAVAATAGPPVRRALKALREKRASVDLLDVAAISVSLATGEPFTGAFITWLLGIGDLLLAHTSDRARAAISRLMKLETDEAWRITGEDIVKVPAAKLQVGDLIVVDAGHGAAADGVVVRGLASVDEKALTGESEPRARGVGDRILAATVVVEGQVVVRVERTGVDTTAAKIVKILEGAGAKPMTLQRAAEKLADRLVVPTFGLAGGAAMLSGQVARATSVLITDFGTGIRIAVPTNALAAMTLAARQGVLVKGAQYLERLSRTDAIVIDKTGTLTGGVPEIVDVAPRPGVPVRELLALCAAAEGRQHHPLAEAIRRHAAAEGVDVPDAELGSEVYAIGRGLSARIGGRTVHVGSARWMRENAIDAALTAAELARHAELNATALFVAVEGAVIGVLASADRPRPESADVVARLRAGGRRRIVLLSGDARGPVEAVARAVGADEAHGEMLPEDKAAYVRELQRQGRIVAMIGDGINDAPALAVADVGISLHGGTDVALETADVVLLEGGLGRLPLAFDAGEQAMARVRQGLGIVIVPNALAIVLGALGLLNPAVAAVVNNGSTVLAAAVAFAPLLRRDPTAGRKPP